jgi:hypothetical protein
LFVVVRVHVTAALDQAYAAQKVQQQRQQTETQQ